jgi:TalC/MipB family fructose-6-phosphate aldolase
MLDSANLEAIAQCVEAFPIAGVTGNPGILKKEGRIDFFPHLRKIRGIIGTDRSLHVQVVAEDAPLIVREAEAILRNIDEGVFIKIPCTGEGFKAMGILKQRGIRITATAIYTRLQGFMAAAREADYIALYYNRMMNMDIDADRSIAALRKTLDREAAPARILAASFRTAAQVTDAINAGAHSVTVAENILCDAFNLGIIQTAVEDFRRDWIAMQGDVSISDLYYTDTAHNKEEQ